jgi:hypothetical protein
VRRTLAVTLLVLGSATISTAQTPSTTRLIPYAGTAVDGAGSALTGTVALTFELYEEQDGGAPLWSETQQVQADASGRYVAYLGTVNALPQVAFSEERARWLAVTHDNRSQPRVMLVAVPYALRAADADTLGGQPASAYVRTRSDGRLETSAGLIASAEVDGSGVPGQLAKFSSTTSVSSSVISESATNRIGVGLPDPTGGGVVDSVFTIRNFDNNTGFAVLNETQQRRFALNTLTNGGWKLYDGGSGGWNEGVTQLNGRVGLGISAPDARLRTISTVSGLDAIWANTTNTGFNRAVRASVPQGGTAILAMSSNSPSNTISSAGAGVLGIGANASHGLHGISDSGNGVFGFSTSGTGVFGQSTSGNAGFFQGNVTVTGTLSKGGGAFKIDHPLSPTEKYLSHSFVESPDMMNVYNGNVALDASGEAWVTLPDWFEALNRDFRYQLTAIGAPGPNLYVASEVADHRFRIAGGTPNGRVSWQVTGIRHDAWANAHRITVEEDKPASERGAYMHPQEHGQRDTAAPGGMQQQ